jgi:RNA polymerase sigma-70 factor (ECF subfamily)
MQPTSTFDLIERGRCGESTALSALFDKHRGRLAVLTHYRLGPHLRAKYEIDDVLQETFLRAVRDFARFEYQGPGSLLRWLTVIHAHTLAELGRKKDLGEPVPFRSPSHPEGIDPRDSTTPSRVFARQETLDRILHTLDQLTPDYREVLILARFEGLSTAEVAARMDKSREQVALLLHRALKRLRELTAP